MDGAVSITQTAPHKAFCRNNGCCADQYSVFCASKPTCMVTIQVVLLQRGNSACMFNILLNPTAYGSYQWGSWCLNPYPQPTYAGEFGTHARFKFAATLYLWFSICSITLLISWEPYREINLRVSAVASTRILFSSISVAKFALSALADCQFQPIGHQVHQYLWRFRII
jgi:hypothetical protein